jgi:histidinol-phosphate aminotransferase
MEALKSSLAGARSLRNSSAPPGLFPTLSRRGFLRAAAGASAVAGLPILTEGTLAFAARPPAPEVPGAIHIDANENPLGPSEGARQAMIAILPQGGRYLRDMKDDLAALFARQEGLDPQNVLAFAGSSEPLFYTVLAFAGKDKPLVLADPGYEAPMRAAQAIGAPILRIPLADPKGAATHDVHAMIAASSSPGVLYVCNPNNPTGTLTSRADLEYAAANISKGSLLLIDEAYIHFSGAQSSLDFVRDGKDVIVLRTFSKIYGMAGIRMGLAIGRPDLLKRYSAFDGQLALPIASVAAAKASLLDPDLVPARKKIVEGIRTDTFDWLRSNGYAFTPSASNCFMLDVRRPAAEVIAAMARRNIFIGRAWPAWPTHVRITVGTAEEMLAFRNAFLDVMNEGPTQSKLSKALA